jgi:hypothetical protein
MRPKDANGSLYDRQKFRLNAQLHQRIGRDCVEIMEFKMMAATEVDHLAEPDAQLRVFVVEMGNQDHISGRQRVVDVTTWLVLISIGQFILPIKLEVLPMTYSERSTWRVVCA